MVRIIGLDISLNRTGISILDGASLSTQYIIPTGSTRREKLDDLYSQFCMLWNKCGHVDMIVVEEALVTKYVDIVRKILEVHGILYATLGRENITAPVLTIAPTSLKKFCSGNGKATKTDIMNIIQSKTGMYMSEDEADATALAYIGKAVGPHKLKYDHQKLSKLLTDDMTEDIFNEFSLTTAKVKQMRKDSDKASRKRYREKKKAEKAQGIK